MAGHRRGRVPSPRSMLADVHGLPQVVGVKPANDAQAASIKGHDKAVFAAAIKDQDSGLAKYRGRVVLDARTGREFRFYVDGDGIRDATDTGEVELSDLYYSGGPRRDLDALLDDAEAS